MDLSRLLSEGWNAESLLEEKIKRTNNWFLANEQLFED
jgi:hypothetical protein